MGVIAEGILRGCQGLFTPVSLGYPLSVFNKKIYSQMCGLSGVMEHMVSRAFGVLPSCLHTILPSTIYTVRCLILDSIGI